MTSRLDRLFILLETGTNASTKRAAAQQLGEAQRLHPHELHHLLSRVYSLLKSTQWDTRIAAAQAVQAIISQVPVWNPEPLKKSLGVIIKAIKDEEVDKQEDEECELSKHSKQNKKLNFKNFNISQILNQSLCLTGSEGSEYDLVLTEGESVPVYGEKMVSMAHTKLGIYTHLVGIDNDLFTPDDFTQVASPDIFESKPDKVCLTEALEQTTGLSRREMNRARRKARQSFLKQRSTETNDNIDKTSSNPILDNLESIKKKIKIDDKLISGDCYNSTSDTVVNLRYAVPDATGCWPDSAIHWPLEAFAENLIQDLFSSKWEVRHGAATAFRELIRVHGKGAGKSKNQTLQQMEESHRQWLIDAALRLLCVLGIDRFGDFISDQVVAPVRETCAQALGSLVMLMSNGKEIKVTPNIKEADDTIEGEKVENITNQSDKKDIIELVSIILNLLKHNEWEARHGAFLALKYLLAIRNDLLEEILPTTFPAIIQGLSDPVEDVGATAASALIPIASDLPRLLDSYQLEIVVQRLWQLLKDQDDLAAACNSFMGLLAAILSLPAARACLTPQPLSLILPRLWTFLGHSSSGVRKATLQTLETLVDDEDIDLKQRWGEDGSSVLQEALQYVFLRVLIEHIENVQEIAERVWEKLIVRSDLELLLHAACPLVSTWLCLAMQPENVPFNSNLLLIANSTKTYNILNRTSHTLSELKVYIGGVETVPLNIRHSNVVRARCMAARMLGLLSLYLVKPIPGFIYSTEMLSPSLCYAKVLLAHLNARSALQRTFAALTMANWATLDQNNLPKLPEILKEQLFICLNESIYYDEITGSVSRLLHECRDYIATLKQYKLSLSMELNPDGIINLDQIMQLASIPILDVEMESPESSKNSVNIKIERKFIKNLEERRRSLEAEALVIITHQQTLNITVMAALAGAATMLQYLPKVPQSLNPLIKPLMESVKKEEEEELQKISAEHLAHLVNLCVHRIPCPNFKIITNLCTFLCSDTEYTPRILTSDLEHEAFNGILTLNNRQKQAERQIYCCNKGPGRPAVTNISVDDLITYEDPEIKAARIRRRGATAALRAIVSLLGNRLSEELPQLWDFMLPKYLKNYKTAFEKLISVQEANELVFNLQVLEILMPSLDKSLFPPIMEALKNMSSLLANPYKIIRHMTSRCIAVLASLKLEETMTSIAHKLIDYLETSNVEDGMKNLMITPNEVDSRRQGASEALACLVDSLGVKIVPYAVQFIVPLLGRMSDQNQSVRLICSATFATLVQLLPLDPIFINFSHKNEETVDERHFLQQLLNPRSIPNTKLPITITTELRSYQQQGLNWLDFLNRYQLHGVLCDDMGLGKTLQTLCMLALDHYRNKQAPTSLIICPPTLTGHWVYEAEKFFQTEDLSVLQYVGNPVEREKLQLQVLSHKLVVVSYDIIRKDINFFKGIQWNYCVLDEGHIIKNGKTKSATAVKKLRARYRLILSGTPVQNNVLELWSLFDFLMPGFLGSEKQFAAKYSKPILACRESKASPKEQEAGALAMESLHRQVLPFLLRRNKEDVLQDLPPKITQDYYCELSVLQKSLYEDFKTKHSANLNLNTTATSTIRKGHVFEALRYLKNVCNHPKLVLNPKHPQYGVVMAMLNQQNSCLSDIEHGAKLPALKQLLLDCGIGQSQQQQSQHVGTYQTSMDTCNDAQQQTQLVSQHRALIFCQLKAMLDIIEHDLLRAHLPTVTYLRLDGSIPPAQRHAIVTRFNADPSIDVLLLTTQIGGLGLNLTGADTVVFVEHDWNPMKDLQAMDRAHRIGQKKVVNVYRLITRHTLEEKIMGLQKFKLLTANTIISTENSSLQTMKTEQLLDLFSLENNKKIHKSDDESINKSIVDLLPDLWEQQQYDDEYNIDSFLSTLKSTI